MRSKIGTKSRLAAHILALIFLLLMLVYLTPNIPPARELKPMRPTVPMRQSGAAAGKTAESARPSDTVSAESTAVADGKKASFVTQPPLGEADTLDKVKTPVVATRIPASRLRPPGAGVQDTEEPVSKPGITATKAVHAETLRETGAAKLATGPIRPPAYSLSQTDDLVDAAGIGEEKERDVDNASGEDELSSGLAGVKETAEPVPSEAGAMHEDDDEDASDIRHQEMPALSEPEDADEPEDHAAADSEEQPKSGIDTDGDMPGKESSGMVRSESGDAGEPRNEHLSEGEQRDAAEDNISPDVDDDEPAFPHAASDLPAAAQPDESGSLVVAADETGVTKPIEVTTPLSNANLEVLGDGVFWLDPRHDLEAELSAIPEIGTLVLLTPLPGFHVPGFEHVKTEMIPADAADLTHDSVEHFLHIMNDASRPLVVAPLSGARGSAFFKGAYLLTHRNLSTEEVMREISQELDQAGETKDEIVHRLLRLAEEKL